MGPVAFVGTQRCPGRSDTTDKLIAAIAIDNKKSIDSGRSRATGKHPTLVY
jgi:hypothetical protein